MAEAVRVFLEFLTRRINPRRRRLAGYSLIGGGIYFILYLFTTAAITISYGPDIGERAVAIGIALFWVASCVVLGLFVAWRGEY